MKSADILKLKSLPYFTKNTLKMLAPESDNTLNQSIKRFLKSGEIIKIKNGIYVTESFYLSNKFNERYLEYLSYVLKPNSYLSVDYVLSKFNVLTDATYGLSAITTSGTIRYENVFGSYSYKSIKKALFTGYKEDFFMGNKYYIAKKSKALFDYLYFRQRVISLDSTNLIEDLRLNLSSFTDSDIEEFVDYSGFFGPSKMVSIIERIKNEYASI